MFRRGLRKPPRVILNRLASEAKAEFERFLAPRRARLPVEVLLDELGGSHIDDLWAALAARPYPTQTDFVQRATYEASCPGDLDRILASADDALAHRVNLLGSGKVALSAVIDWSKDFKTGFDWPARYFRDIEYTNPERPSDVKIPWELSRLQWLIPAGQAYLLTGDERYAEKVRSLLEHWIDNNPYAGSVNWACTMEAALRIFTWTWFFHVFHSAQAWKGRRFREKFLCALFLHVDFTERHIERSDVNGNHYTADAAGLVFGGLFFGRGRHAERWQQQGWSILSSEIDTQVHADGVDFEASVPYHRLVTELFLFPALYRASVGMPIEPAYRERLRAMAGFTAAYTKPDGSAPLWGDADDARALPFGGQRINDHRYLVGLIGKAFDDKVLATAFSGPREEIFWVLGAAAADAAQREPTLPQSIGFPHGGFFVMRSATDHVFIDCGPVGLGGRGGHGHNDCLAFEAVLDRVPLITDCGAYVYTASYSERNAFRSTAYHNTPQVDGEEINRFIRPDYLWNVHYDAVPCLVDWQVKEDHAVFRGEHSGYRRLSAPVVPRRTILLDLKRHALFIGDEFSGRGEHDVALPLHLAPGVVATDVKADELTLCAGEKRFIVWWDAGAGYTLHIEQGRASPSYGLIVPITRLCWRRDGLPLAAFALFVSPERDGRDFSARVPVWLACSKNGLWESPRV